VPPYSRYRWAETPEGGLALTIAWLWCRDHAAALGLEAGDLEDSGIEVAVDNRWHRESAWRVGQVVRGIARTLRDSEPRQPSYFARASVVPVGSWWSVRVGWHGSTEEICAVPTREAASLVALALRPAVDWEAT
jgi:hypothetical protein